MGTARASAGSAKAMMVWKRMMKMLVVVETARGEAEKDCEAMGLKRQATD